MAGAQVLELVLSWVVTTALTFVVVVLDTRWMSEEARERSWPSASRDAAILAFGLLAVPVHFAKTRGSWRSIRGIGGRILGLVLGVVVTGIVAVASGLLVTAVAWVCGLPTTE